MQFIYFKRIKPQENRESIGSVEARILKKWYEQRRTDWQTAKINDRKKDLENVSQKQSTIQKK